MRVQQSFSGFVAGDPILTVTERGDARLYLRVGQEHFRRNDDGTFTKLDTTYHDLVAFRRAAEQAADRFSRGDHFIAEGYVHGYDHDTGEGVMETRDEFVAKKIGHDCAATRYTVDRTARRQAALEAPAPGQEAPAPPGPLGAIPGPDGPRPL